MNLKELHAEIGALVSDGFGGLPVEHVFDIGATKVVMNQVTDISVQRDAFSRLHVEIELK